MLVSCRLQQSVVRSQLSTFGNAVLGLMVFERSKRVVPETSRGWHFPQSRYCSASLGSIFRRGPSPPSLNMPLSTAKLHARNGLQHVLRSMAWVSVSVSLQGSVSVQELKHAISEGKERNPDCFTNF